MSVLITGNLRLKLFKAWQSEGPPILKLFGGGACTWLVSEMNPEYPDELFGLCDPGLGYPELGYLSFAELAGIRFPPFGLGIERDRWWKPEKGKTMGDYAHEARIAGRIAA
jgi:hypothetical protein